MSMNDQQQGMQMESNIVKLRGLPWNVTPKEILQFLEGVQVAKGENGVHLITSPRDGRPNGEAFVECAGEEDVAKAFEYQNKTLGHRYIEIFNAQVDEFENIMNKQHFVQMDTFIKLRGLPYSTTPNEIESFFDGLQLRKDQDVHIVTDIRGRATGEAFVRFGNLDDTEKALKRNREKIGSRYIEIFRSTASEFRRNMFGNNRPGPYDRGNMGGGMGNGGGGAGSGGLGMGGGGPIRNNANGPRGRMMRGAGGPDGGNNGPWKSQSRPNYENFYDDDNYNGNGNSFNGGGGGGGGFGNANTNGSGYRTGNDFTSSFSMGGGGNRGFNAGSGVGGSVFSTASSMGVGGGLGAGMSSYGGGSAVTGGFNGNGAFGGGGLGMGGGGGSGPMGGGGGLGAFRTNNGNDFVPNNMGGGGGGGNFNNGSSNGTGGAWRDNSLGGNGGGGGGGANDTICVHMRGMPYYCDEQDIYKFFAPLKPINCQVIYNNRGLHSGEADALFATHGDAMQAMQKNKEKMGTRYIELFYKSAANNGGGGGGGGGGIGPMNNGPNRRRF